MHKIEADAVMYKELLQRYLDSNDEQYLVKAKQMSSSFVSRNIYPEEIVRIHMKAMNSLYEECFNHHQSSLQFLLESLIAYRIAHEKYEKLNIERLELKSEIQVAANMQKTLLATEIPKLESLDIGAISVPFRQLNGDYYHFTLGDNGILGVAIADVIGKGVPAALSMSMIRYAMDSFYEEAMSPDSILRHLNRVVERNVASNMFITMLYGQYFIDSNIFRFSSAGHEPGFIYRAKEGTYSEIEAKGIVLGVLKHAKYHQYETRLEVGDKIVLLTDGVTECRRNGRFIKKEELMEVIDQYGDLPAQKQVEQVHRHFRLMNDFELKDDFTLIIMKRVV